MILDPSAESYINAITPEGKFFRVSVSAGGCNGYSYNFSVVDSKTATDRLVGAKVVVDPRSYLFLKNATLKWQKDLFAAQFIIVNQDATATCGCGSSFSV